MMSQRASTLVLMVWLIVARSADSPVTDSEATPPDAPAVTSEGADPETVTSDTTAGGTLESVAGEFDIERVRLSDPSELPVDDVPVPVPWGGEAQFLSEFSSGATVLHVTYDPRFFQTAAAFYQTWIAQEGLEVTDQYTLSTTAHWEVVIDGDEVEIEVLLPSDESATHLSVTFGGE